ncbi:hypothetical protein V2S66_04555 [Streptomyces sp. V4-01]|uniref:Secreted protein n=1 Tax=Actinacidiphila polyblastidii TaxID=3110430 RepID=A0ABU7P834_9ACTN|nr:hypothetical protein [Streptomyces sp. V4-01]
MRTHRITGVVVSLALVGGVTGGVLAASSASAEAPHHAIRTSRPVAAAADRATIIAQARTLGGVGHVATPVAKFVEDAVAGDAQAATLAKEADAAKASIAATREANTERTANRAARDAASDALTQLQTALDGLVKSLTDSLTGLLSAATGVVSGLVDTLSALLGGLLGAASDTASAAPSVAPSASAVPAVPVVPAA